MPSAAVLPLAAHMACEQRGSWSNVTVCQTVRKMTELLAVRIHSEFILSEEMIKRQNVRSFRQMLRGRPKVPPRVRRSSDQKRRGDRV